MSFTILSTDPYSRTVNVSFNAALNPVTLPVPFEFWLDAATVNSLSLQFRNYINGFAPSPSFVTSEVARLRALSKQRTPVKIYIPPYLFTEDLLMQQVNIQVELNRIILLDEQHKNEAEYVMLNDWQQDLLTHQNIAAPNSDNYIYLRNRFIFLSHISNIANHILKWKASDGEINVSDVDFMPINFLVPKSRTELTEFLDEAKQYVVLPSLSKRNSLQAPMSPQEVQDYFDDSMFTQNSTVRNLYSMQEVNQSYIVEEFVYGTFVETTGQISRPIQAKDDPSYQGAGVLVSLGNFDTETSGVFDTLQWVLQYTFFYFASPVKLKYVISVIDNRIKLTITEIDPGINLSNPSIDIIYCN